jgi:hypothetical protein
MHTYGGIYILLLIKSVLRVSAHTASSSGRILVKDSFEQVTRVLPEDGAVRAETRRTDLINNIYIYIYSTVCVHLVGILKI